MPEERAPPAPPLARRLARLLACCGAAALIWACGPVYIPVPPPTAATQTAFTAEMVTDPAGNQRQVWIAVGAPHPPASNGTYYLLDQDRNSGVIAGAAADGSYRAPPMEGTAGDRVLVRYIDTQGVDSDSACFILSDQQPVADRCPP